MNDTEFKINKYILLRLEGKYTVIFVNGKRFNYCKRLFIVIPDTNIENYDGIESIDEATDLHDHYLIDNEPYREEHGILYPPLYSYNIPPEDEFWGHCSNIQAWVEHDYDTRILHSNLAFPLLKELTKAGDTLAAKVFREEVAKRFEKSNMNVRQFLLYNHYLDCLNKEELDILLKQSKSSLIFSVTTQLKDLLNSNLANFKEIKELIDIIVFIDLVYNRNLIIHVLDKLNTKKRSHFARFLIFHLNYKEFISYKIPYGRFSTYFEDVLKNIYVNYPEIKEFLKSIDSGFLNNSLSLDESQSYGFVSYL